MNALLTITLTAAGFTITCLNNRIVALEEAKNSDAMSIYDIKHSVSDMQADVCALLDQMYDLREFVEKRTVSRRKCP